MKILPVFQNTPEWEELRRTKIGASDCPIICGKSPYKTSVDLWQEKMEGKAIIRSAAMEHGSKYERDAVAHYKNMNGLWETGAPQVVQHDHLDYMIASIDCLFEDHILEVKCPQEKVFEEAKRGKPQEYWIWQVQHQLEVTGLNHAIICVYDPSKPEQTVEFQITRDEEMIAILLEREKEFHDCLINFTPPSFKSSDLVERTDADWFEAEDAWVKAKDALKEAQELEKICREGLIYLSEEKPSKGLKIVLTKIAQPGRVDYSKVPELKGVDLTPYRKEGYTCWKIQAI